MNDNMLVEKTEQFVKDRLSGEGTGHDWWHVVRVVNVAKTLHEIEGGDWLTIKLTLLLHDVGDRKVINQDNDDYTIAEMFLVDMNVSAQRTQDIMSIIRTMSFSKSFDNLEKNDSIEFKIVQDADRLDAIGAIGVGRAFAFGGSRSRLLYDPEYKAQSFESSDEYKKTEGSTIHHFYEKLFLLKENLNTETARKIAEQRDKFMHLFVDQFLDEWNGQR